MMFTKVQHAIAIAAVALILSSGSAHADSIVYNFVGTGAAISNPLVTFPEQPVGFQLTAPDFVNPPHLIGGPPTSMHFATFTCAQLDTSTNCRPTGTTLVLSNQGTGPLTANMDFLAANSVTYVFFFPTGAFGAPGTYSTGLGPNIGTLTVTALVPEPTSIVLLLAGVVQSLSIAARGQRRR